MSRITLTLLQPLTLRIDLSAVSPAACSSLGVAAIEQLSVPCGNRMARLGDLFRVEAEGDEASERALHFIGDLSRADRIGQGLANGRVTVEGHAGDHTGQSMTGGDLHVIGDCGRLAGCEMSGGSVRIDGNAGDFAAASLPGSMDGMRGGLLIVRGSAGHRLADRMRRGTVAVFGDAGDFLASRMVAGTVALGGRAGAHPGYGMRRGSIVFAGAAPEVPVSFVPAVADAAVFWQLLSRDLALHGGPFAGLPARQIERHLGDLSVGGKGEFILLR